MAVAKCKICGNKLDTTAAHLVITRDKNGKEKKAYYCSIEEYQTDEERKKKAAVDKDRAYRFICDIVGRKEIINTILWKEWVLWNKVATNDEIGRYLEENITYLSNIISNLENNEFKRIRYLSAILKNHLGDYKPKTQEKTKPKVVVEEIIYESVVPVRNSKRRSLADLEDEF